MRLKRALIAAMLLIAAAPARADWAFGAYQWTDLGGNNGTHGEDEFGAYASGATSSSSAGAGASDLDLDVSNWSITRTFTRTAPGPNQVIFLTLTAECSASAAVNPMDAASTAQARVTGEAKRDPNGPFSSLDQTVDKTASQPNGSASVYDHKSNDLDPNGREVTLMDTTILGGSMYGSTASQTSRWGQAGGYGKACVQLD